MSKSERPLRLLFIAPLPEPTTGMSLASLLLLQGLPPEWQVDVVNLSKASLSSGFTSVARAREILGLAATIRRAARDADMVYFTISQSVAGNLKDLLFFQALGKKRRKCVIHLHGGPAMRKLMQGGLGPINRHVARGLSRIVILGERHKDIFNGVDPALLATVPNGVEPHLFLPEAEIEAKFDAPGPLNILSLANFVHGKGQKELVEAWISLPEADRSAITVNLAGRFDDPSEEMRFRQWIEPLAGVHYHGSASGALRQSLLQRSHILSAPSYHHYGEGQPLSILEAYAAGCAVFATDHGGTFDVFEPGVNGLEVEKASATSIAEALQQALADRAMVRSWAIENRRKADRDFTLDRYRERLIGLLQEAAIA